jgi:hypothetical protein
MKDEGKNRFEYDPGLWATLPEHPARALMT